MQRQETAIPTVGGEFATNAPADVVDILLRDHARIRTCLDELDGASSAAAALPVLERLKGIVTVHHATEETLVYPALAKLAGEAIEPRKLYVETAEADMLLFELDNLARGILDGDFENRCATFTKAVRKHLDTEEQHAFPHLREKTANGQLAALNTAVRQYREKLHFEGVAF
ncbi:MAG TPA: hemerythrin domain-containing protein [Candidatus Elarobacter sp.]|jgi:hemerythrin-like domain-containing protein